MTRRLKITKKQIRLLLPILLLVFGVYLLITALAPAIPPPSQPEHIYTGKKQQPVEIKENRLYIPKISVDVAINEGTAAVLEKGAWHRKPENGNPEKGGNFVLSAHRFELGFTPQRTRAKSPFYHVDKLQAGDKIFVDYNQKRYTYEVTKKYKVDRNAVQIEAPSIEPKMTLYSCDLRGEKAGREVIEASRS
ncbi:MAG TPA: class E sortase [Nevskiaceae bacterium]|nr:class E sortase [Nevskiaceae bacterium]